VIGEVASVESRGQRVIDSHVANEGDYWRGSGAHPWHLDEETESILYILVNGVVNVIATGSYGDCNGLISYQDVTGASTWTSGNPAIATVNNTTHKGQVTGVSGGATYANADHSAARWLFSPNIGCFQQGYFEHMAQSQAGVQVPTSLSIVAGTSSTTSEATCTTGGLAGCGVTRAFKYQVNDQSGQPIRIANMGFGDVICNTSTNQLNLQSYTTTCGGQTGSCWGTAGPCSQYTDANGQFNERIPVCAPACISSGTCCTAGQTIANQTWTVDGYTLNSDVKSITFKCNTILVNGN